jgi:hypothetical protein
MTDRPHRYFFVHIMKTAGNALRQRLINHFGEVAVYPAWNLDGSEVPVRPYLVVEHLLDRLEARGDQIRVVTGHFPLRTADLIPGRVTTLMLLREPVERTLSYLRQRQDDSVNRFLAGESERALRHGGWPLEKIYDDLRGLGQVDNHMTRMLSLAPQEMLESMLTPIALTRSHLEHAKEALTRIDAIGLQENFEEFCTTLSARFDWRLGEPETINTTTMIEVPNRLRARIAEDNALDIELYELAQELVASRTGRHGREPVGVER